MRTGLSKLQDAAQGAQQAANNGSRGTEQAGNENGESGSDIGQDTTEDGGIIQDGSAGNDGTESTSGSEGNQSNASDDTNGGNSAPKPGSDSDSSGGSSDGGSSIGNLAGVQVNLKGNDQPINGLNKNLAKFANETTTFSHIQDKGLPTSGNTMKDNLDDVKESINSNIKLKSQNSSASEQQQLQELNALSDELNKGTYAVNNDANLSVADDILRAAQTASISANDDSDDRNPHRPTPHYFATGSTVMLDKEEPSVLIAIDASGSMWFQKSLLVGAANLLTSIANKLKSAGVTSIDYAFWDTTCDIPQPFVRDDDSSIAQDLANGKRPSIQSYEGTSLLKSSVGGGGTNVFSVVARLSRYDENGDLMYDDDDVEKYNLKFADRYNLIIIYSDFDFPSNPIPRDEDDIIESFGDIPVSSKLCCVCCDSAGEKQTPQAFKDMVKMWISFEDWKHDIDIYRCQPFDNDI